MSSRRDESMTTLSVQLAIDGAPIDLSLPVPAAPARPRKMLPVLQALAEEIVDRAVEKVQGRGATISCKAGCGACCRQLVPISRAEAHALRDLVEAMPEPRRTRVRERFAEAKRRLIDGGMGDLVAGDLPDDVRRRDDESTEKFGLKYFHLGIACPFLEDESCSIHVDRPVVCREYLVVSPAELCAHPSDAIEMVPLAGEVSEALRTLEAKDGADPPFVPISLALDWAEAHPDAGRTKTGPEMLSEILKEIAPTPTKKSKRKRGGR